MTTFPGRPVRRSLNSEAEQKTYEQEYIAHITQVEDYVKNLETQIQQSETPDELRKLIQDSNACSHIFCFWNEVGILMPNHLYNTSKRKIVPVTDAKRSQIIKDYENKLVLLYPAVRDLLEQKPDLVSLQLQLQYNTGMAYHKHYILTNTMHSLEKSTYFFTRVKTVCTLTTEAKHYPFDDKKTNFLKLDFITALSDRAQEALRENATLGKARKRPRSSKTTKSFNSANPILPEEIVGKRKHSTSTSSNDAMEYRSQRSASKSNETNEVEKIANLLLDFSNTFKKPDISNTKSSGASSSSSTPMSPPHIYDSLCYPQAYPVSPEEDSSSSTGYGAAGKKR